MPIVVNKDEKVQEICQKAYELLIQDGIKGFSLNKFASTSGISKGQFYHYFKTKDDLVFEVMSQKTMELIELSETYINEADKLLDKLLIFYSLYISDDEQSSNFRALMFDTFHIYIHSNSQSVQKYNKKIYEWMDKKLIELFALEGVSVELYPQIGQISFVADGMYLRSLMIDSYDLKQELTKYLTYVVHTCQKNTSLKEEK